MSKKEARKGRPPLYTGKVKQHIVSLMRRYGITGAHRRLNAENKTALANDRNVNIVPEPLGISVPTLQKFANEAGLEIPHGRPSANLKRKRGEEVESVAA